MIKKESRIYFGKSVILYFTLHTPRESKRRGLQAQPCRFVNPKHDIHVLHSLTNGAFQQIVASMTSSTGADVLMTAVQNMPRAKSPR